MQTFFPQIPLTNFYDANGDNLTFSVTGLPSWAFFDVTNMVFSGRPTADSITSGVTFIVDDGWGGKTN